VSEPTGRGPGRLLVAVYATFAVAASSRAGYQLATKYAEAPVPYLLSVVAVSLKIVATVALLRDQRRLALLCIGFELVGVLVVGVLSVVDRGEFPDATVWSAFGAGYGYVPLVLPVLGLLWLRRTAQ
jgi:hypothetical protein